MTIREVIRVAIVEVIKVAIRVVIMVAIGVVMREVAEEVYFKLIQVMIRVVKPLFSLQH